MPDPQFLTEDEFETRYDPWNAPGGDSLVWEYEETKRLPIRHVWTVIEVDGVHFVIPGYHVVNRLWYYVTAVPWEHENIEVRLDSVEDHETS